MAACPSHLSRANGSRRFRWHHFPYTWQPPGDAPAGPIRRFRLDHSVHQLTTLWRLLHAAARGRTNRPADAAVTCRPRITCASSRLYPHCRECCRPELSPRTIAATYARASVCEEEGDLGACEVSELAADPCARSAQGPPASTQPLEPPPPPPPPLPRQA